MPRVTEQHRRARRDEIAEAALRVLRRNGVSSTSIAQIVDESGLSAGAIYANFENKSELARYIAQNLFDWRLDRIAEAGADGASPTPVEVVRTMLATVREEAPPVDVILQFWGEAATDPDLHAVLTGKMTDLRAAFAAAIGPWAERRAPAEADALARRTAEVMIVLCQGFLAHDALLGWVDPDDYLATAAILLTAD